MDILSFDKILYHYDKIDKLKKNEVQFPVHVTISLGNYCNHKCLWCTVYEYQQSKAKQLDVPTLINWLGKAKERGVKAVGYVGHGEPTAHRQFGELINAVHDLGIQQGMFTNGYLLDRYMDDVIKNFTYVRISLDAGSPAMHAKMHDVPENHYGKIMNNLREMVARRKDKLEVSLGVQYAVHHQNLSDLHESARQCAEIGVDYFSIKPVFNRGSVGERIEKNELTLEELMPVANEIKAEFEREDFEIHFRPFQIKSEEANRNILKYDTCVAGSFNLSLLEDGDLLYCGPNHVPVGNVDDDLDTIEENILKLQRKLDLSKCPGGCRYHALNRLVHTVVNPDEAAEYHINFL